MPPKFSLQSVLEYQQKRVDLLEVDLGRLQQSKQAALDLLNQYQVELVQIMAELSNLQNGDLDMQAVMMARLNVKRVQNQILNQKMTIQAIEKAIAEKRQEVILARQDEAAMETLRDKEIQRFNDRVIEQEKRQQDDIYTSKAHTHSAQMAGQGAQ